MADRKDVIGKCYTYRGLKFYAQNGFVCLHDESTGEFYVVTRREFLERAAALSEEAKRMRTMMAAEPGRKWVASDRLDLQHGVEQMLAAAREAKEQGDRTDPKVDAWFMRHRPNRKSLLSMANGANFTSTTPGSLPLGKDTGRHVKPDFSVSSGQSGKKKLILPGDM
jgi:hypothetical protein